MIDLVMGPRRSGRSTKLVEWILGSTEGNVRVGVFRTPDLSMEAYRSTFRTVQPPWLEGMPKPSTYEASPVESWQFISWQEFEPSKIRGTRLHMRDVVFGVDDLDAYVHDRLGLRSVVFGTWEL